MFRFLVYFALTVHSVRCSSLIEVFQIDQQPHEIESTEPVGSQTSCSVCKMMLNAVDDLLEQKSSQEDIKEALDTVCRDLKLASITAECLKLVDTYSQVVINYIVLNMDPEKICKKIGLCSVQRKTPAPVHVQLLDDTHDKPFSFASFYQDHMVLQATPWQAVIWGYNTPDSVGQKVTIRIIELNKTYTTLVGPDYKWSVKMAPVESGGPFTVQAGSGEKKIAIKDVLFGDIWLCSGQSNMQFAMSQVFNSKEELKDAVNYPHIRVFTVKDNTAPQPLDDIPPGGILQPWALPGPGTLGMGDFTSFSAVCWLYGKYLYQHIKKPIGLIDTSWGGTTVEAWSSPDALKKCGLSHFESETKKENYNPDVLSDNTMYDILHGPEESSVLWNAMIHPLLNMTIYGAIWYQGENNAHKNKNMNLYNCTFPAMIVDWRRKFTEAGGTSSLFPFGFVQLSGYKPDRSVETGFPDIRWHQTADYGYVPNHKMRKVFMAVAMDLPDFLSPYGPIHPRDKQDVAQRLVQSSLAIAYNQSVVFQGPFPVHVTIEDWIDGAKVNIIYSSPVEEHSFEGFELCCSFTNPPVCHAGKSWWIPVPVEVDVHNTSVSTLLSMDCKRTQIVGVRYAWYESPCAVKKCAIYGKDSDLPLPPFTFADEEFLKIAKYV